MATRKVQVDLSVSYKVSVQEDTSLPFNPRVNENFSNAGSAPALAAKQDQDSITLIIPAAGNKTIDVSNLGTIDYMYLKGDAPFTVQFGTDAPIPVTSILVKDGALPTNITSVKVANADANKAVNLTYSFLGH